MKEKMNETRDDRMMNFWKRLGCLAGVGCAFVPGMVVGLEIVAKDTEKESSDKK